LCVILTLQPYGKRPISMLFLVSMQASTTFVILKKMSNNYQFYLFISFSSYSGDHFLSVLQCRQVHNLKI
jgi:hypothetical protein